MLSIRIDEELHRVFKLQCVSENRDMGSTIIEMIEKYTQDERRINGQTHLRSTAPKKRKIK